MTLSEAALKEISYAAYQKSMGGSATRRAYEDLAHAASVCAAYEEVERLRRERAEERMLKETSRP